MRAREATMVEPDYATQPSVWGHPDHDGYVLELAANASGQPYAIDDTNHWYLVDDSDGAWGRRVLADGPPVGLHLRPSDEAHRVADLVGANWTFDLVVGDAPIVAQVEAPAGHAGMTWSEYVRLRDQLEAMAMLSAALSQARVALRRLDRSLDPAIADRLLRTHEQMTDVRDAHEALVRHTIADGTLMSLTAAAQTYGVTRRRIYQLIDQHDIPLTTGPYFGRGPGQAQYIRRDHLDHVR